MESYETTVCGTNWCSGKSRSVTEAPVADCMSPMLSYYHLLMEDIWMSVTTTTKIIQNHALLQLINFESTHFNMAATGNGLKPTKNHHSLDLT